MPNPICSENVTVSSQAAFDNLTRDCYNNATHVVVLDGDLNIFNYTDSIIEFRLPADVASEASLQTSSGDTPVIDIPNMNINNTLLISTSQVLETLSFGNLTLSTAQLIVEDLPRLTKITRSGGSLPPDGITLRNLPQLQTFPSAFDQVGAKTTTLENIGSSAMSTQPLSASLGFEFQSIMIVNTTLASYEFNSSPDFNHGNASLTFQNPIEDTLVPPFNISLLTTGEVLDLIVTKLSQFQAPALQKVNGNLAFNHGPGSNITLPDLSTIGGNFSITNMANITNIGLGSLTTVGGTLQLMNNTGFADMTSLFPVLESVNGDFYIQGPVTNLLLHNLKHVGGEMHIESTAALDCAQLDLSHIVSKDYTCKSNIPSSSHTKLPRIIGGTVGGVVVILLLLLGLAVALLIRRKKKKKRAAAQRKMMEVQESSLSAYYGRHEMEQHPGPVANQVESAATEIYEAPDKNLRPGELDGGSTGFPSELDGQGNMRELE